MNLRSRLLSILLIVTLVASILPVEALASSAGTSDSLTFKDVAQEVSEQDPFTVNDEESTSEDDTFNNSSVSEERISTQDI